MSGSVLLFLNIGGPEMILIVFVALLLFGGEKLPEIARGLGKGIRDFKDASEGVKREITNQINNYEDKKTEEPPALNAAPEDEVKALPPAEEHNVSEHQEIAAEHTETPAAVPNTMAYVEPGRHVSEAHVNG